MAMVQIAESSEHTKYSFFDLRNSHQLPLTHCFNKAPENVNSK